MWCRHTYASWDMAPAHPSCLRAGQPEFVVAGPQLAVFCDRLLDPDSLIVPLLRAQHRAVILKRATWVPPAPSLPPEEQAAADKLLKAKEEAAAARAGTRGVTRARQKPKPGHRPLASLCDCAIDLLYRQVGVCATIHAVHTSVPADLCVYGLRGGCVCRLWRT